MEGSPYRERARLLMCPRCRELLDVALDGVRTCMRCEGLWLSPTTFTVAFGHARGPTGTAAWWRNSIECPECAVEGRTTMLQARMCGDVLLDTCMEHGLWLDRGELAQLLGTSSDELHRLRAQGLPVPDLADLVARREKWRADGELRRRTTAEYHRLLEDEHRRREALEEQMRLDAERAAAEERARRPVPVPVEPQILVAPVPEPPAAPAPPADERVQPPLLERSQLAPPPEPKQRIVAQKLAEAERDRRLAEEQARVEAARRRAAEKLEEERTAAAERERVAAWNRERREAAERARRDSEARVSRGAPDRARPDPARLRDPAGDTPRNARDDAPRAERAILLEITELEKVLGGAQQRLSYLEGEKARVKSRIGELTEAIARAQDELARIRQRS